MPKLLYHTGACSLAPHIVLEWIGAPYEVQPVEFGDPALENTASGAEIALDLDCLPHASFAPLAEHRLRLHFAPQGDPAQAGHLHLWMLAHLRRIQVRHGEETVLSWLWDAESGEFVFRTNNKG